jgi:hypothetical protein
VSVAGYELNSNNSPRDTISQNNSIVISVCNLACAARFRANAGAKSVGMIDRLHAHPSCSEQPLLGRCSSLPSVKSGNMRCWQKLRTASDRPPSYSARMRPGGSRRISPSCQSYCRSCSLNNDSGLAADPAKTGTVDWVHTSRCSRSGRPSIVETLKTRNSWRRRP